MAIQENDVRAALDERARAWIRDLRVLDRTTSTNDVVKDAARQGAPEGTVVIADAQTTGRGRQGRAWVSRPGNLFLSILLRPKPMSVVSLIPLAAGIAVADAMGDAGVSARLKWPNDVLVNEKKLAGILAEATTDATGIDHVALGIGVNVNLDIAQLPDDVKPLATSLAAETGRAHELAAVAAAVLTRWVLWYDALRSDRTRVRDGWKERAVDWWGHTVEVDSGGQRLTGLARDVDSAGGLILEMADGGRVTVLSGDARKLRPAP